MNHTIKAVPLVHGLYYAITALWPLVHTDSFLAVTGNKTDIWLVKTVSVLLIPYAVIFTWSAGLNNRNGIVPVMAIGACTGLLIIDLYYYYAGILNWFYLLDAFAEMLLLVWWLWYVKNIFQQVHKNNSV